MTLRTFISIYQEDIDALILEHLPSAQSLSDVDRRMWIMKDEELYQWAQREGVSI